MDANGTRVFCLATPADWRLDGRGGEGLHCCPGSGVVRLAGAPLLAEDRPRAAALARMPSATIDGDGVLYLWRPDDGGRIIGRAAGRADAILVATADLNGEPRDLAVDDAGVMHIAMDDGSVALVDTRGRWQGARRVSHPRLKAGRLAPRLGGGAWILDLENGRIGVLSGRPPADMQGPIDPAVFQREDVALDPPRIRLVTRSALPEIWTPVGVSSRHGRLAVLAWRKQAEESAAIFILQDGVLVPAFATEGITSPFDIAWIDDRTVALLAMGQDAAKPQQVPVFDLPAVTPREADSLTPREAGGLRKKAPSKVLLARIRAEASGFINAADGPPSYVVTTASGPEAHPLRAISAAILRTEGFTVLGPFDAGEAGAIWHRLRLEGALPGRCGVLAELLAAEEENGNLPGAEWWPHVFGTCESEAPDSSVDTPRAAWLDRPSEMPHHPGRGAVLPSPGRDGLFSVLVQRSGRAVRTLRGRYLWIRLTLRGDSRTTPSIRAFRVSVGRLSYRDRYLPELYGEPLSGVAADARDHATGADFLERFLALFEEPMTMIEDQIAAAHLLTDPATTPAGALAWLGSWIGVEAREGESASKLRERLRAAPRTARLTGTPGGLAAALEIETGGRLVTGGLIRVDAVGPRPGKPALADIDGSAQEVLVLAAPDADSGQTAEVLAGGAVTAGRIVVVEGFRLRRTAATILGADLASTEDPLTAGGGLSGNAYVGDTLILGDAANREFLALFGAQALRTDADAAAAAAFLDRLAFTVLVLVRREAEPADRRRLAEVARRHAPAHVDVVVAEASQGLVIGLASILGVDGFLAARRPLRAFRQDRSRIGRGDRVDGGFLAGMAAAAPLATPAAFVVEGRRGLPSQFVWKWR